ncbi:peptide transporter PTR2A [Auriculariales sp. MPI-PUGE-AT-0066]|nr:peptide transporter PTR2A [Auriculariales sp. MPI-PUGE-AT-0066]
MTNVQLHRANDAATSPRAARGTFASLLGGARDQYQRLPAEDDIELDEAADDRGDDVEPLESHIGLRRVADDLPWNTYLIAIIEMAERFSYYGSTVVFTNFIQQPMPQGSTTGAPINPHGQPGALGLGQRTATATSIFNSFWVYLMPLLGAYMADAHWGRYKTVCVATGIALVGHMLLVYSALPSTLEHPSRAFKIFIAAILVMGTGTGAFKSNISPLVAEQYQRKSHIRTLASGERVYVDRAMTISRTYLMFYVFINIGSLAGQISMTYAEKYYGFYMSFALPTVIFLFCPIILYLGRNRYISPPPAGASVLATSLRTFRLAARGRWSLNPFTLVRNFKTPGFWDDVKPSHVPPARRQRWMTFDDQWVEELRRAFGACAVFAFFPLYWLPYGQMATNMTSQAATMMTHGLPNDIMSNIDPIVVLILGPIFDRYLYPALGPRMTTPIKRIAVGFMLSALAMAWEMFVQMAVYGQNPCGAFAATCKDEQGNNRVSPISVFWIAPAYVIVAISELLASVTALEHAYTSAPPGMRSLVTALYQCSGSVTSIIGECFVWLAADPLLVWNYAVTLVLTIGAGVAFWKTFRQMDAEDAEERVRGGREPTNLPL